MENTKKIRAGGGMKIKEAAPGTASAKQRGEGLLHDINKKEVCLWQL